MFIFDVEVYVLDAADGWIRLEEKIFVIFRVWGQRGEGNHSKFPAIELWMRLGGLNLKNSRKDEGLPSAFFLPWEQQPLSL